MQRDPFHATVDHPQLDALVVLPDQQRLTEGVGKRSPVKREVVRAGVGDVIVAMHRLGNQPRIVVTADPLTEFLVQILIVQIVLTGELLRHGAR